MTAQDFCDLHITETSTVVLLKEGQPHTTYYGSVRTTRKRGDYSPTAEFWFLYQNTPRRCVPGQCGFQEV